MRQEQIGNATLYLGTMEETIGGIQQVDHILTDPPYLYIKTHDFDKEFDEQLLFENAKRLLPDNGFIALFGRGSSFYRWNTRLAGLGFTFKEEIVWDKRYTTAPCIALSRIHETVSIHTKKTGKIRRSKVPYVEQKQYDIESIVNDVKRIKSAIRTEAGLNKILAFLQGGELYSEKGKIYKHYVSQQPGIKYADRAVASINAIKNGSNEKSILRNGMNKSILICNPERYKYVHPTEKPVRLAERILALISDPGDTIYDPFMGSGSFGVACVRTGRKYIGSEMKPEYFEIAYKRIKQAVSEDCLWQA